MNNSKHRIISEINVTSLVDVTMVMLIIFMITAPLMRSGIEVELPKTKATDLKPYEGVVVTLMRDGTIKLNDVKTSLEKFDIQLLQLYAASSKKMVMLQADKDVPYGKVIQIMDRIKGAGINNVGLIVQPEKEP